MDFAKLKQKGDNMLLEFQIQNYKSFLSTTTLSMLSAPKQTDLAYSILKGKGLQAIKALCSSIIYGPNASGKTNLIGAMEVFQSIVSRGHIRNVYKQDTPNFANFNLELIPNSSLKDAQPVCFTITFFEKELEIKYSLKINLGKFLEKNFSRLIQEERLIINQKDIFSRSGESLQINNPHIDSNIIHWPLAENPVDLTKTLMHNLNPQELFLTGGFKSIVSRETAELVIDWITKKFQIIYQANSLSISPILPNEDVERFYVDKLISDIAQEFGIGANAIGYIYNKEKQKSQMFSVLKERHIIIPAKVYESLGTIRVINIFPLLVMALINGKTLFIDEFDASIHPMAIMSIINIFHNNEINKNKAQLIFNSHNPIFLNGNLFRRDEIKFVDRDESSHISELYSLADFGTSGKNGVRKSDDYMKNYFINRYGAIHNLDFSPIFEKIMSHAENNQ